MLITLARIFAVIFTILVATKSYLDYRARRESLTMTAFWITTWVLISVIAFSPQLINYILGNPLQSKGGAGTILGVGLIFIYFVIYRIYVKADRIEKQLNKVIRGATLKSIQKKAVAKGKPRTIKKK